MFKAFGLTRIAAKPVGRIAVKFEEAGRAIDREVVRLTKYLDLKVKPATRQEMATLLRKASARLKKLADKLEKAER